MTPIFWHTYCKQEASQSNHLFSLNIFAAYVAFLKIVQRNQKGWKNRWIRHIHWHYPRGRGSENSGLFYSCDAFFEGFPNEIKKKLYSKDKIILALKLLKTSLATGIRGGKSGKSCHPRWQKIYPKSRFDRKYFQNIKKHKVLPLKSNKNVENLDNFHIFGVTNFK